MKSVAPVKTLEQWSSLWDALAQPGAQPVLVFKRSPVCPTSFMAERIFDDFIAQMPDLAVKVVKVDVIDARPVSQRIAADTKIRHESPQALLLLSGQIVAWHASHGDIDAEALEQQLQPYALAR